MATPRKKTDKPAKATTRKSADVKPKKAAARKKADTPETPALSAETAKARSGARRSTTEPTLQPGASTDRASITDEIIVELNGVRQMPPGPDPHRLDNHAEEYAAFHERLRREQEAQTSEEE